MFLLILFSQLVFAAPTQYAGIDLRTGKNQSVSLSENSKNEYMVVAFLSARCPCSDSHIEELKSLSAEYKNVRVVGIHSNGDEPEKVSRAYFSKQNLPFPVLEDAKAEWADALKAAKTPHVFVLNGQGETVYRGGVSDSSEFPRAKRKFLREALEDLKNNRPVRTPEARALGCAIVRG